MGKADQFAKRTFAEETERITEGAVEWQDAPEIGLVKVQGDGFLLVRRPEGLAGLLPPWSEARDHKEVLLEIKMPGDHVDIPAFQRALLRRQARQVQRVEAEEPPWPGEEPLWLVAPYMPKWLSRLRTPVRIAPGCYRIDPAAFSLLWIAANELPLSDELLPFLVARSGRAFEEFVRWAVPRKPAEWVVQMVHYTSMSTPIREDMLREIGESDDPELVDRRREIIQIMLKYDPEVRRKITHQDVEEARLAEARSFLRRVLSRRGLAPTSEEEARIDACRDHATLERWLDQAITAPSAAEALQ